MRQIKIRRILSVLLLQELPTKKRKQGAEEADEGNRRRRKIAMKTTARFNFPSNLTKLFETSFSQNIKMTIPALEEEWLNKKPKGKLPKEALIVLKQFWNKKICWPYPTEEDKAAIKAKTTLDAMQINNWFINQRKRHWLKMFQIRQIADV